MKILTAAVLLTLALMIWTRWSVLVDEYLHDSQNISIMLGHRF
jgi:hypothetical protein